MSNERDPVATRQKVLEATQHILRDGGYFTQFTLEAVAEAAGISKGGLLHHFPSKAALLRGLTRHIIAQFELRLTRELANEPEERPGRWTRAYIRASLGQDDEGVFVVSPALLAFVRRDSKSAELVETRFNYWQQQTEQDGLDIELATIIRLAVDGLVYTEIIDSAKVDPALRTHLAQRLLRLTEVDN